MREDRVIAAQIDEVLVKLVVSGIFLAFGKIEFRHFEGMGISRISENGLHLRQRKAAELAQEFGPAFPHLLADLGFVIAKEKERSGRAEFLALKQHGSA